MNYFNKKIISFFICILLAVCLVSCSNPYLDDNDAIKSFDVIPEPTPIINVNNPDDAKGNITMGLYGYDTLNPLLTQNKAIQKYMTLVYDSLIVYDIECKPSSGIAKSWETLDGGYTWKIRIYDNVFFHDGAQLTVYDVKNTLEWIKNNDCYYSYCAKGVVSYKIISQFEIDIVLENVDALFPHKLNFPVLKSEDINSDFTVPNGTGMYKFVSADNNNFSFEINKLYFGICPKIKTITVKTFDNAKELNDSNVDVILNFGDNVIKYNKKDLYDVCQYNDSIVSCMIPSDKIDMGVRKFVNTNINRELLIKASMADCAVTTDSILPEEAYFMKGYSNLLNFEGVVKPQNLSFIVCKEDEDLLRLSEMVKTQFEKIEVVCDISILETDDFNAALLAGEYDFAFVNFEMKCVPEVEAMIATNGALNYNSFNDDSVNRLIDSIKNAYSEKEISSVVDNDSFLTYCSGQTLKLASRLKEVLPFICLCRKNASVSLSRNVTGVSLYNFNYWNTLNFTSWEMRE